MHGVISRLLVQPRLLKNYLENIFNRTTLGDEIYGMPWLPIFRGSRDGLQPNSSSEGAEQLFFGLLQVLK